MQKFTAFKIILLFNVIKLKNSVHETTETHFPCKFIIHICIFSLRFAIDLKLYDIVSLK